MSKQATKPAEHPAAVAEPTSAADASASVTAKNDGADVSPSAAAPAPPAAPTAPPPPVTQPTPKTVKMTRHPAPTPESPTTADVALDEVDNWRAAGWELVK